MDQMYKNCIAGTMPAPILKTPRVQCIFTNYEIPAYPGQEKYWTLLEWLAALSSLASLAS